MSFDLKSARPVESKAGFDLASARPVDPPPSYLEHLSRFAVPHAILSAGKGLASGVLGAAELLPGTENITAARRDLDQWMAQRRAEATPLAQDVGPVAEFAGGAVPAVKVAGLISKALPVLSSGSTAAQIAKSVPLGALQGAAGGAITPDNEKSLQERVGMGGLLGAGLGPLAPILQLAGKGAQRVWRTRTPEGREAIQREHIVEQVGGEDAAKRVAAAMQQRLAESRVPGSKPTVGELLVDEPSARAILAQEQRLASQPLTAGRFAERAEEQTQAAEQQLKYGRTEKQVAKARERRDLATGALREAAIEGANAPGVAAQEIADQLSAQRQVADAILSRQRELTGEAQAGWSSARKAEQDLAQMVPGPVPVDPNRLQTQVEKFGVPPTPLRTSRDISETARLQERVDEGQLAGHTAGRELATAQQAARAADAHIDQLDAAIQALPALTVKPVLQAASRQLRDKEVVGDPAAYATVKKLVTYLRDVVGGSPTVDAETLYALRRTGIQNLLNQDLAKGASHGAITIKAADAIKSSIDDAVEAAGGTGFKDYLKQWHETMKKIEESQGGEALRQALRPKTGGTAKSIADEFSTVAQRLKDADRIPVRRAKAIERIQNELETRARAAFQGSQASAEATKSGMRELELPHFISSKFALTNFYLRHMGKQAEEKLLKEAAALHLDPDAYIRLLTRTIQERPGVAARSLEHVRAGLPAVAGTAAGQY